MSASQECPMDDFKFKNVTGPSSRNKAADLVLASVAHLNERNGSKTKTIKKCVADLNGEPVSGTSVIVAIKRLVNSGLMMVSNGLCSMFGPPLSIRSDVLDTNRNELQSPNIWSVKRRRGRRSYRSKRRKSIRGRKNRRKKKGRRGRKKRGRGRKRHGRSQRGWRKSPSMAFGRARKARIRSFKEIGTDDCPSCVNYFDQAFSHLKPSTSTNPSSGQGTSSRSFSKNGFTGRLRRTPQKRGRKQKNINQIESDSNEPCQPEGRKSESNVSPELHAKTTSSQSWIHNS